MIKCVKETLKVNDACHYISRHYLDHMTVKFSLRNKYNDTISFINRHKMAYSHMLELVLWLAFIWSSIQMHKEGS